MFIYRKLGSLNTVRVELYSDLQGTHYNSLDEIIPVVEDVPGFRVEGGERKFVTLYDECNGTFTVIIGPQLCQGYYYHRQLLQPMIDKNPLGKAIAKKFMSGGGEVKFTKVAGEPWQLEFGGKSGDFGVFNQKLLFYREVLQDMLGTSDHKVKVSFCWKD